MGCIASALYYVRIDVIIPTAQVLDRLSEILIEDGGAIYDAIAVPKTDLGYVVVVGGGPRGFCRLHPEWESGRQQLSGHNFEQATGLSMDDFDKMEWDHNKKVFFEWVSRGGGSSGPDMMIY